MKASTGLCLRLLDGRVAMCQLPAGDSPPKWAWAGEVASITSTPHELSVVCSEKAVPQGVACQGGWRVLELEGPLDPNSIGLIALISSALAQAEIPICVISTCRTDYFLVRDEDLGRALQVLEGKGHRIKSSGGFTRSAS